MIDQKTLDLWIGKCNTLSDMGVLVALTVRALSVVEAAEKLGVSTRTIRRSLDILMDGGVVEEAPYKRGNTKLYRLLQSS